MITSDSRGHETYYDGTNWRYRDTDGIDDGSRPCKRCGRHPTPEGYDACIGHIEGATSACCGHGWADAYAIINGEQIKLKATGVMLCLT